MKSKDEISVVMDMMVGDYNPNHDPATGRFTEGGGSGSTKADSDSFKNFREGFNRGPKVEQHWDRLGNLLINKYEGLISDKDSFAKEAKMDIAFFEKSAANAHTAATKAANRNDYKSMTKSLRTKVEGEAAVRLIKELSGMVGVKI